MSNFWAGVIGALIGAVVGGAFTTVGAVLQVRGTLKSVYLQGEISARNDQEFQTKERYVQLLAATVDSLNSFYVDFVPYYHEHDKHSADENCAVSAKDATFATSYRRLNHFYLGRTAALSDDIANKISRIVQYADEVLEQNERALRAAQRQHLNKCRNYGLIEITCSITEDVAHEIATLLADAMGLRGGLPAIPDYRRT